MADTDNKRSDSASLEQTGTTVEGQAAGNGEQPAVIDTSASGDSDTLSGEGGGGTGAAAPPPPPKPRSQISSIASKINVYMLGFILLLVVAGMTATILYLKAKSESATDNSLSSQSLSQSTLDQLANTDVTVGEPKH